MKIFANPFKIKYFSTLFLKIPKIPQTADYVINSDLNFVLPD